MNWLASLAICVVTIVFIKLVWVPTPKQRRRAFYRKMDRDIGCYRWHESQDKLQELGMLLHRMDAPSEVRRLGE